MSFDKAIDNLQKRVTVLEEEKKKLKLALEFYANRDNHQYYPGTKKTQYSCDGGDIAREALK